MPYEYFIDHPPVGTPPYFFDEIPFLDLVAVKNVLIVLVHEHDLVAEHAVVEHLALHPLGLYLDAARVSRNRV